MYSTDVTSSISTFSVCICSYWAVPAVTANTTANTAIHDSTDLGKFLPSPIKLTIKGEKIINARFLKSLLQLIFKTQAVAIVNYLQLNIKFKEEI